MKYNLSLRYNTGLDNNYIYNIFSNEENIKKFLKERFLCPYYVGDIYFYSEDVVLYIYLLGEQPEPVFGVINLNVNDFKKSIKDIDIDVMKAYSKYIRKEKIKKINILE
jgi:hypothetical protein